MSSQTDSLTDIHDRLVHMSEGLVALGLAASNAGNEGAQKGLGNAVYIMGLALDDLNTRLEAVNDQLRGQ